MKIEFAFFAESAVLSPEGSFHVLNGGIDGGTAKEFPSIRPEMVLLVKFFAERDECDRLHEVKLTVKSPDNNDVGVAAFSTFAPVNQMHPESGNYFNSRFDLPMFSIHRAGVFVFEIQVDNNVLMNIPFEVTQEAQQ